MRGASAVVAMAYLLSAATASAESPTVGKAAARAHYQRGVAEYELEHYDRALAEFEAGFTAMPEAAFLFNLAIVHAKLGHKAEALKFYRKYVDRGPPDAELASLQQTIARLERELAEPQQPPPPRAPEPVKPPVVVAPAPVAIVAPPPLTLPPPPPKKRRVWPVAVGVTAGVVVVALTVGLAVGLSQQPNERVLDWSAR